MDQSNRSRPATSPGEPRYRVTSSVAPADGNVRVYDRPSRLWMAAPTIAISIALAVIGLIIVLLRFR